MTRMLDQDDEDLRRTERELTLSTGTLLGIFLALVLLCGAFFGFGYRIGSHSSMAGQAVSSSNTEDTQPANVFNSFKPAAGSPAVASQPATTADSAVNAATGAGVNPGTGAAAGETLAPTQPNPGANGPVPTKTSTSTSVAGAGASAVLAPSGVPVATSQYVVQVAAVSHQEDAELLVSALRAKGYPVTAHTEPQDKFFHIQVGPFSSLQDANAAKQRLLADGYQPIIK
ncbi:MAG: SPOR domain-containing protein [Acidobacteriaceae bacterium]